MPFYIRVNGDGIRQKPEEGEAVFYGWDNDGEPWSSHETLRLTNAVLVIQREHPDARVFLWADEIEEVPEYRARDLYWNTYGASVDSKP